METQVDILMAVFNGEKFIDEQIQSILDQTRQNFRLIIRDNHSTDSTPHKLKEWSQRFPNNISATLGTENLGVLGNFSALTEHAQAPYIMFSDSDDIWIKDKIEKTLTKIQEMEQAHGVKTPLLVHTDLTVVDRNLNVIHDSFWKYTNRDGSKPLTLQKMLIENAITGCTMIVNRSLLELAIPIPLEAAMHDAWLGLVVSAFGKIASLSEPTILYRQHGTNDSGANLYNFFSLIMDILNKEKRQKISLVRKKRFRQALLLLNRYQNSLDHNKKSIIENYIDAHSSFFLKRGYLLWKFNLFESGLLRKIFQLICSP